MSWFHAIISSQGGGVTPESLASEFQTRVEADGGTFEAESCLVDRIQHLMDVGMWEKASAVWMPHGKKAEKYYAVKGGSTADFAFSRGGGTRTRQGPSAIETVAADVPALDYTNDVCPAWSLEKASTNLFLQSETLETQNVTVTAVPHTISFYGTGTITLSGVSTAGPLVGTGEDDRVELTFTPAAGTLTCTVTGTVTKAQCEAGSYATSYIPTTTATVSRIADSVTALTDVADLIGQTEGTLYFEGRSFADGTDKRITLNNATSNEQRAMLQFITGNKIQYIFIDNNIVQGTITNAGFVTGTKYKIVATWKANKITLTINGVKIGEDLTVTTGTLTFSRVTLDGGNGTLPFYGEKETLLLSTTAISDEEAEIWTTI